MGEDTDRRRRLELPLDGGSLLVGMVCLLLGLGGGGAGGTFAASSGHGAELKLLAGKVEQLGDKVGQLATGTSRRLELHEAELRARLEQAARLEARLEQTERRIASLESKR